MFGAIVTLAGSANAPGLLLVRFTTTPPAGAFAVSVTVTVAVCPELTLEGDSPRAATTTPETTGGLIVNVPVLALEFSVAVTVAVVCAEVGLERMTNEPLAEPAGIVTLIGTTALLPVLERLTVVPPAAAGPPSVTVPVALCPPVTVPGAIVRSITCRGFTFKVAAAVPLSAAVMVTAVGVVTVAVLTVNVPVVCPAAIETAFDANVATVGALLANCTTAGPIGA